MSQALSSQRSWIARISVLAMLASLLAFGAAPAGAAIATDNACPASIPSAGFTDLAGVPAAAVDAIDCIAFYNVSTGTTATTFDPFADVTRWQMALFLTRLYDIENTLPSGADQGFTDLAGVPAAAVTSINQLAQLGISTGTTATTFDPFADVERWQMALFLTRLFDINNALPSGADQGFADLAGVPAAAVTAINQLAQLQVSEGTSATTFDPFTDVARWAMALFLTRTMEQEGIVPSGLGVVSVTPAAQATQGNGTARLYTANVDENDGSNYTGQVIIRLLDANSDGTANGTTLATGVNIEAVDGGAIAATTSTTRFLGSDGQVTFLVRHTAGATNDAIPQVIRDSDTDGVVDSGEERGLGGATFFTFTPAELADDADTGVYNVCSTNKAADYFVIDAGAAAPGNCAAPTTLNRLQYDNNDVFLGDAATFADFEDALSVGDTVRAHPYEDADADQSTFTLVDNTTVLSVTNPTAPDTVDSATDTVGGAGNPGWEVVVYRDQGTANTYETAVDPAVTSTITVGPDGSWSTTVNLTQSTANNFIAVQRSAGSSTTSNPTGGNTTADDNVADVPTITESANAGTLITSTVGANVGTAGTLSPSDTIAITIDDTYSGVGNGDTITIVDIDGSTAVLTLGTDASFVLGGGDTVLTLTLTAIPTTSGGTAGIQTQAQITAITGFTDSDGAAINIAGSGAGRVFTGF